MNDPELLSRGRSAEVYDWGDDKILKLFYDGTSSDRVKSEATITDLVYRSGLPVPEVFDTIDWNNRHGILFEKIEGISMLDVCIESPLYADEYGRTLANIHSRIHHTTIETLPDSLPLLIRCVKNTELLTVDQKHKVVNLLESQSEGFQLLHMDFHPDQVLITENGPRVIDWETACRGNPLSDVARTSLILSIGEIPRPTSISNQDIDKVRGSLLSAYLDEYFGVTGKARAQTMIIWDLVAAIVRLDEAIDGEQQQLKNIVVNKIETCSSI